MRSHPRGRKPIYEKSIHWSVSLFFFLSLSEVDGNKIGSVRYTGMGGDSSLVYVWKCCWISRYWRGYFFNLFLAQTTTALNLVILYNFKNIIFYNSTCDHKFYKNKITIFFLSIFDGYFGFIILVAFTFHKLNLTTIMGQSY